MVVCSVSASELLYCKWLSPCGDVHACLLVHIDSSSISCLLEALLSSLPVNDIPNSAEVFGLAVLILQVVSVLPRIDTKDRAELADNGVLVCVGADLDGAGLDVLHQPGPAGALNASEGGVELLLQRVEGPIVRVDGLCESTRRRLAATLGLRREVLPEERVIGVPACRAVH